METIMIIIYIVVYIPVLAVLYAMLNEVFFKELRDNC